jgi:hypothetical protein
MGSFQQISERALSGFAAENRGKPDNSRDDAQVML